MSTDDYPSAAYEQLEIAADGMVAEFCGYGDEAGLVLQLGPSDSRHAQTIRIPRTEERRLLAFLQAREAPK